MSVEHLKLSDYQIDIPDHLIAQHPLADRTASRLMVLDGSRQSAVRHHQFNELPSMLNPGDLLVLNDTKVIPARLYGKKDTGGRVEILVERILPPHQLLVKIRASKSPRPGSAIFLDKNVEITVDSRREEFYVLTFPDHQSPMSVLENQGEVPLPPYITRAATSEDATRYQTVYGQNPGAVAAPTAGLHFDESIFGRLEAMGVNRTFVTLHVGAGTFQPVRVENPADHVMHAETVEVSESAVTAINETREAGGRIIAVGTTSVRSLESAARAMLEKAGESGLDADSGSIQLEAWSGESRLFLRPGSPFYIVDGMITNFHLPESTLMMLVSAFAGHSQIMQAYKEAVDQAYRFYSYGDAMLLWPAVARR